VPTPLLSLFEQTIGISPLQAVVLYASYSLGVIVSLLGTAMSGSRIGLYGRVVLGLVLAVVAALVFAVTASFPLLLLARVLSGLASGAITSTATTLMVALGGSAHRERSAVSAVAANFGGLALGAILGGCLSSVGIAPRQLPFLIIAAIAVALTVGLMATRGAVQTATHGNCPRQGSVMRRSLGRLTSESRPVFVNATIPSTIAFTANALVSAAAAFYVAHELDVSSRASVGVVIAIGFVSTAAGQLVVRRVSSRASQVLGRTLLFTGTTALLIAMLDPSWGSLISGSALIGAGTGVATGAGLASITHLPDRGETAGLINRYFVILYLGLFIPITALGLLEQSLGVIEGTEVACLACLSALLVSFIAMNRFWRRHPGVASR
jgi:MFS family permease